MFKFKEKKNTHCNIDFNKRGYEKIKSLKENGTYNEFRFMNQTMIAGENKIYETYNNNVRTSEEKLYNFIKENVDLEYFEKSFSSNILRSYLDKGVKYDKTKSLFENVPFYMIEKEFIKLVKKNSFGNELMDLDEDFKNEYNKLKAIWDSNVYDDSIYVEYMKLKETLKHADYKKFMADIKEFDDSVIAFYEPDSVKCEVTENEIITNTPFEENLVNVDESHFTSKNEYIRHLVKEIAKQGRFSVESEENEAMSAIVIKDEFTRLKKAYKEILDEELKGNIVEKLNKNLMIKLTGEELTYFELALNNIPKNVESVKVVSTNCELEKLYFKYIEDLYNGVTSVNKMKNKRWLKASELDSEYSLASTSEKRLILNDFQVKMKNFKNEGRNVDRYILELAGE